MASINVLIKSPQTYKDLAVVRRASVVVIANLLYAIVSGAKRGSIYMQQSAADPVASAATITITHANVAAADTVTVLGQVYTARASGAVANEFNIGADATADAVNLAAALNANATFASLAVATSALGVVTIRLRTPGVIGNYLAALATSKGTAFALSNFSGGAGGASGPAALIGR